MKKSAIAAAALAISGCATKGPMTFTCNGWDTYAKDLPPSKLVKAIQSGGKLPPVVHRDKDGDASVPPDNISNEDDFRDDQKGLSSKFARSPLLLSGGGQWGAFGVGAIKALSTSNKPPFDNLYVITGVSTGALQSLFVAAGQYDELKTAYTIKEEKDLVDRGWTPLAAVRGSVATLGPLRKRLEKALCQKENPKKASECSLIKALKDSERVALIGVVDASTGKFQYVNTKKIAEDAIGHEDKTSPEKLREAQQCLAGAAIASSAMPVFFQQVRINGGTYYDGGVRKSIFEARIIEDYTERQKVQAPGFSSAPVYVIRNGPTKLIKAEDTKVDRKADALNAALRSYELIVNEVEVQSIAGMRLAYPSRAIKLITADGFDSASKNPKVCVKKDDGSMFDRDFMKCLMEYGAHTMSEEGEGWIDLPTASELVNN